MRILVINPNTNVRTTDRIKSISQGAASDGTTIEAVTAPYGAKVIKTLEDSARANEATLSALTEHATAFDAAVIAAFSDPGLRQAKMTFQIPVVGIGEAAMLSAAAECERFSIVTMGRNMDGNLRERAAEYGVGPKLASIRFLPWSVGAPTPRNFDTFVAECLDTIERDGAGTVIIGGGPLAGFAQQIAKRIRVPVLDATVCAVHLAESLIKTHTKKTTTD